MPPRPSRCLARSAVRDRGSARPRQEHAWGFPEDALPSVFELLGRIGQAVVATVGSDCEVVVHDLRYPEHSVVSIHGNLTGRKVGAPIPDPELLPGEVDKFLEDDLRRSARTAGGRELVASTVWVRDRGGYIRAAMCLNLDLASLRLARDLIERRLESLTPGPPLPTFAADVLQLTRLAATEVLGDGHASRRRPGRAERAEILRRLDATGLFVVRGAAKAVAAELGVSRASLYADLQSVRREAVHGRTTPARGKR